MKGCHDPYSPQSDALKESFGAFGTLGKKVKPVSCSMSAMDFISRLVTF